MGHNELLQVKENVGGLLLDVDGIVGVGIEEDALAVMLVEDNAAVKKHATDIVHKEFPGTLIKFVVTGHFKAL